MLLKSFRLRYFLGHLFISALIASFSLYLIFFIWYPKPLDIALGVGHVIWLMLGIDVVLGPLLTLILAKEGKKSLKFDLTIIGLVQLSALCYGLYSIEKGRPVAIAFDINRFEIVQKYALQGDNAMEIIKQFAHQQAKSIPIVAVRPAKDDQEFAQRMNDDLEKGISATARPELYETLEQNASVIHQNIRPLEQLSNQNDPELVKKILKQYPAADGFILLASSEVNMVVLVSRQDHWFAKVVDLRQ